MRVRDKDMDRDRDSDRDRNKDNQRDKKIERERNTGCIKKREVTFSCILYGDIK